MNIFRAGIALSIAILLGRISGLIREMVLASQFGAGASADMAVLLLTLPDLLVSLLLSGGLTATLTPAFRRLPDAESVQLLVQSSFWVLLFLSGLSFVMAISPPIWLDLLAPGLEASTVNSTIPASRLVLLALPLSGLTGVFSAFLNSRDKFFLPACGTLVFNATFILGLLKLAPSGTTPVFTLALIVVLSAAMRWFLLGTMLPNLHIRKAWAQQLINKPLVIRFAQALLASCVLILYPVVARSIVSLQGTGQIALFNYASKLVELPLGIAITVISAIALPKLATLFADPARLSKAFETWRHACNVTLILSLAIFLSCIGNLSLISSLIFGHGRLEPAQVHALASIAAFGFISILFQSIHATLSAGCHARLDTRLPLWCNLLGLAALYPCCYGLAIWFGTPGVALGLALSQAIACSILWMYCEKTARMAGHTFFDPRLIRAIAVMLPVGAVVWYGQTFIRSQLWIIVSMALEGCVLLWISIGALTGHWHPKLILKNRKWA